MRVVEKLSNIRTLDNILEFLEILDSVYREAFYEVIEELGLTGNNIFNKKLTREQVVKVITNIAFKMEGDFQYSMYNHLFSAYIDKGVREVSFDNLK